ncbi:MAG TPA: hypothetical protein VEZ40_16615 [Pyrinomonadaceae bacterium]|nr:hypothetical protein [Pyrinomonadaceae bacterium]
MGFDIATAQQPVTVVAVGVRSPDLTVKEMKYRVFYNKTEVKKIPLLDYDFKAALGDELLNALAEDMRMEWRALPATETIDVFAVQKQKAALPPLEADRVLLVGVEDFGAFLADLAADKFYLEAKFKLIDRATGKKLWEKKLLVTEDLDGKLKDLQADNQKALKIGVNKVLERVMRKMVADLRLARI